MSAPKAPLPTAALALIFALGGLLGTGCASNTSGPVKYSVNATQNYKRGLKRLEKEDWVGAAKYFAFVKARFPYSEKAVLAELRLADAEFGAKHYLQAIDNYKLFIKYHPTHEFVVNGYCDFRIGQSFYKQLGDDFWLLPPVYEKDQSTTSDAHRQLIGFIRKYPNGPYTKKSKKMLAKLDIRLARHEWYVAKFYWDRDRPMGTVLRLRRLLSNHPGVGYDAEALWLLGRAYVKTGMKDRARKAWMRLLKDHPGHKLAPRARRALASG